MKCCNKGDDRKQSNFKSSSNLQTIICLLVTPFKFDVTQVIILSTCPNMTQTVECQNVKPKL